MVGESEVKTSCFLVLICLKRVIGKLLNAVSHVQYQSRNCRADKLLSFLMIICITCVTQKRNPMITMVGINRYGYVNHD